MVRMVNLNAFVVICLAIASFMIGSSNDLTEQVVIAQNRTEDNNTDDDSTNESGSISNLPTPIRPPFA
ncbi:MAG: hypothetical protein ACRD8Z_29170, partial [Nitrososphaeraceae archaeon]